MAARMCLSSFQKNPWGRGLEGSFTLLCLRYTPGAPDSWSRLEYPQPAPWKCLLKDELA